MQMELKALANEAINKETQRKDLHIHKMKLDTKVDLGQEVTNTTLQMSYLASQIVPVNQFVFRTISTFLRRTAVPIIYII
jgi:hypothetical protein